MGATNSIAYSIVEQGHPEADLQERHLLSPSPPGRGPESVKRKILIDIQGMTCSNCSGSIERLVADIQGVESISVSLMTERAEVVFRPAEVTAEHIVEEIEDIGFDAKVRPLARCASDMDQVEILIEGPLSDDSEVKLRNLIQNEGVTKVEIASPDEGPGVGSLLFIPTSYRNSTTYRRKRHKSNARSSSSSSSSFPAPKNNVQLGEMRRTMEGEEKEGLDAIFASATKGAGNGDQGFLEGEVVQLRVFFDPKATGIRHVTVKVIEILRDCCEGDGRGMKGIWIDTGDTVESQQLQQKKHKEAELRKWRYYFVMSLVFTLPVFFIAIICRNIESMHGALQKRIYKKFSLTWEAIILFVLATPVQFGPGQRFVRSAYMSIRHGAASMDVLIALGSSVAYFYSLFSLLMAVVCGDWWDCTVFFDTSAMLITVVLLGRMMEHSSKGRTSEALTKLMTLQPKMAEVVEIPRRERDGALMAGQTGGRGGEEKKGSSKDDARKKNLKNPALLRKRLSSYPVTSISIHLVQTGDILLVKRGAAIPVDGTIVCGRSGVNQGMVTGEAMPVYKKEGDKVIGGTTNMEEHIYMQSTCARPSESVLSKIVKMVQDAQSNKPPIQALADRVASVFVPTVVLLSVFTFLVWMLLLESGYVAMGGGMMDGKAASHDAFLFALMRGVAVLVVSCPCSLGLATPTAIMVATGVGAALGILYKSGRSLEMAGKTSVVVFDKTGTLTESNPRVVDSTIIPSPKGRGGGAAERRSRGRSSSKAVWRMVAAVEHLSEHILGATIAHYAMQEGGGGGEEALPAVEQFEAVSGMGVVGRVAVPRAAGEGKDDAGDDGEDAAAAAAVTVAIGNMKWVLQHAEEKKIPASVVRLGAQYNRTGFVAVYVCIDGRIAAVLALSDALKPGAKELVRWISANGMQLRLLTGDSKASAEYTAREVGILSGAYEEEEEGVVQADMLPQDKIRYIKRLQEEGHSVLFIGDGINDAPALAQADVGVSMTKGTDVAIETADVVLVNGTGSIQDLATVIDLSKTTISRIKINFAWALVYNVISIPVAAGILYPAFQFLLPPVAAAFMMGCSSSSVVLSSLWLKRYGKPELQSENSFSSEERPLGSREMTVVASDEVYNGSSDDMDLEIGD